MNNLFRKFFSNPYACNMERNFKYECWLSVDYSTKDSSGGFKKFFEKNNFLIAHNMFDESWEEKIQLEEIFKKLILIYEFNPNDENIIVIYKNNKPIYLPNNYYLLLPPRAIFAYDKSKIKVFH